MDRLIVDIQGFEQLQERIKRFSDDKDKRKTINAILRNSAKSTIKVAQALSPKDTTVGSKSIKYQVMRRAKVPMGIVGPRSSGKYDGWYLRQFVIPGHNIYRTGFKRKHRAGANDHAAVGSVPPNYFMNQAQDITQGRVAAEAIPQTEKFLQRLIDRLG